MKIITDMLEGKTDISTFMREYMVNEELYRTIQMIIPLEAFSTPDHDFWCKRSILRKNLECYNNDVRNMLFSHCGFGERAEDRLEIFNTIKSIYLWKNPKQKCTPKYENALFFYLELEQDCFGGPEVIHLVKNIAAASEDISPKTLRKKIAKQHVKELFHIANNKKPHWLHGPNWPMGLNSPMMFCEEKREDKLIRYTFMDVDTGERRDVIQHR